MEQYQRKTRSTELSKYDHLSKPFDMIEVTDWYNGEGFDVYISTASDTRRFGLTWGEYEALQACVTYKG